MNELKPSQAPIEGNLTEQILIEDYLTKIAKILNRDFKEVKKDIESFVKRRDVKMLDAVKGYYEFYYQIFVLGGE